MITPFDAWAFSKLIAGETLNGELDQIADIFKPMAGHLNTLPKKSRGSAWQTMMVARPDAAELINAVAAQDPTKPAPLIQQVQYATAASIRASMSNVRFHWEPWIPVARIVGIAALEGIGKTRFLMDLCRRVYLNLGYPGGQPVMIPKGSPMIWVCADGQHEELVEMLKPFGLPDDAIVFPALPDDPTANTSLDAPETFEAINHLLETHKPKPWAITIDSMTYATTRDLCEQRSIAILKAPLVEIVQQHQINVLLSLHVSQSGQALGRRIKGITRTLMHLECEDPESHPERLRLWMEKSYRKKPDALGVTMHDWGNDYDNTPPAKVDPTRIGRPSDKIQKAMQWLRRELAKGDRATIDLEAMWVASGEKKGTFYNARDKLANQGVVIIDTSSKPQMLHLDQPAQP